MLQRRNDYQNEKIAARGLHIRKTHPKKGENLHSMFLYNVAVFPSKRHETNRTNGYRPFAKYWWTNWSKRSWFWRALSCPTLLEKPTPLLRINNVWSIFCFNEGNGIDSGNQACSVNKSPCAKFIGFPEDDSSEASCADTKNKYAAASNGHSSMTGNNSLRFKIRVPCRVGHTTIHSITISRLNQHHTNSQNFPAFDKLIGVFMYIWISTLLVPSASGSRIKTMWVILLPYTWWPKLILQ